MAPWQDSPSKDGRPDEDASACPSERSTKVPHARFEKGYHLLPNRSNKLVDF